MNTHAGKRLFITGIPTAGKSYLAKLLAEQTGAITVFFDKVLDGYMKDPHYEPWINFYWNQDERTYLTQTSPEDQRHYLMQQAECFWPLFAEQIRSYQNETRPVIFDSVSLFPSLVRREFDFPGIILAGSSVEETLARNQKDPRWSKLPELQKMEAEAFFYIERPLYMAEAKQFDLPVFEKADEAVEYCINLLK
jgi:hypothetical protein